MLHLSNHLTEVVVSCMEMEFLRIISEEWKPLLFSAMCFSRTLREIVETQ